MKDIILGNHLRFARAGKVIDGVTVGPEAKPDTDPSTNYTKIATVETWQPRRTVTRVNRREPAPGGYQDKPPILFNKQIEYAFGLQEWSDLTLAEMLLGGKEPVAGLFVPNDASEDVTGWWIMQGYKQDNEPVYALNVYGAARVEPYTFGEKLDPFALIIRQTVSTLNTGETSNLS